MLAAAARAQSTGPATPPPQDVPTDAGSIILAKKMEAPPSALLPDPDAANNRVVSSKVAAALSEGMPKYSPPTPTPTPVPETEEQDMRDVDKPKNQIKRLPKYVVHESRPPIFQKDALLTDAGKVELYIKEHPGLRIGNLWGLNSSIALAMARDEQRLSAISDLQDTARAMARGGDADESKYIMQATQDAYIQNAPLWSWNGPGGNGGNSGGLGR